MQRLCAPVLDGVFLRSKALSTQSGERKLEAQYGSGYPRANRSHKVETSSPYMAVVRELDRLLSLFETHKLLVELSARSFRLALRLLTVFTSASQTASLHRP